MAQPDAQERYLAAARKALQEATVDDLLAFISVRRIVGGTATAAFYQAFPGGREQLLEELKREAAPETVGVSTPVTVGTISRAIQLVTDLKDGRRSAVEQLREIALANFDENVDTDQGQAAHVLRGLMAAVADADEESRERLDRFYDVLAAEYADLLTGILAALGREPTEGIPSVLDLTRVITSIYGGLAVRSRLGQPGKALLAATLLPILAALTVPAGEPSEDPVEKLLQGRAGQAG